MNNNLDKKRLLTELLTQAEKVRNENGYKAASLGQPAYDLAEDLKDLNGMAKAMYYIYVSHYYGKKENNMALLHQALQRISPDEVAFIVRFYNLLGLEHMKRSCFQLSVDSFSKGLEVAQKSGRRELICLILNNTGEVFRGLGDYNRAVAYYQEAYNEGVQNNDDTSEDIYIYALDNLVVSYSFLGDLKKAKEYLNILESLYKNSKNYHSRSRYTFAHATYLMGQKEYKSAIKVYEAFISEVENFSDYDTMIETYRNLGDCYCALNRIENALANYTRAYELSVDGCYDDDEMYCMNKMAMMYQELNNLEKAFFYHRAFSEKVYERRVINNNMRSDYVVQRIQFDQMKVAKNFAEEAHRKTLQGHEVVTKAYKRLDLAVAIGNAIKSNTSYRSLLLLLHNQISKLMPLASIAIGRYRLETMTVKMLYIIDNKGVRDDIVLNLSRPERFHMKTCILERCSIMFRTRKESYSEYLADYPLQEAYSEVESALYVPIISCDEVKGVITVQSKESYAYTDEDLKVLEVISAYFAQINLDDE